MNRLLVAAMARLLPVRDRDAVLGDLEEEGRRPGSPAHMGVLAAVVVRFHVDPWRDASARWGALLTAALGWALLLAVPAAAWPEPDTVLGLYDDPLSRGAIHVWSAAHLSAALAAGLVVGHSPRIPGFAGTLRWQVALALALPASWGAPGAHAVLAPLLLMAATWLGQRALTDAARESPHRAC
jgi:hypothetical protein